ncbi:replication licensing factor Cdt1, partial [Basidiobolus ranarum]
VDDAEEKLYDNQTNIYETVKLAGSNLELRLKEFRRRLINIVKAEHEKFLASLSIGVDVNNRALLKWHPQFDLNTVPDIPKSDLPTLDRPVISIAKSLRLEKSKSSTEDEEKNTVPSDASGTTPHSSALAKASSLLDRIRAKEKKRNEDIMFGLSPEILSRKTMLSRIPAIADSINFIFTSSKKTVLRQGEVVRKIIESYKTPLSEAEVMDHLKLVSELAPKWLKLMPIGNSVMVKLDRLSSVKDVKEIFKTELQKVTS